MVLRRIFGEDGADVAGRASFALSHPETRKTLMIFEPQPSLKELAIRLAS